MNPTSFKYIRRFGEGIDDGPADPALLGGKGAGLAAMGLDGLPVPPGFTIVVDACRTFHEHGVWPAGLADELDRALAWLEETTGRRFGAGERPLLVSVRSGAARSMPGMMDTLLNVGLDPGQAHAVDPRFAEVMGEFLRRYHALAGAAAPTAPRPALARCVEAVWHSWNSERAHAYRRRHRLTGLHGTAVNIQEMFPSEVSGVVFTRDPRNPDADEMIVEAAFGLGESVVSGDVTPDRYRLARATGEVRDAAIGRKGAIVRALGDRSERDPAAACLDTAQLAALARLCLRVEERRGGEALDIEFGLADGRLAILQARAIRGLDVERDAEPARLETIAGLRARAPGRRLWIRHNLDETLSHPTPMTWALVSGFMSGRGGFGRMYSMIGYRQSAAFRAEGFLDCVGGRIYADPERAAGIFWDGLPLTHDLDLLRREPRRIEAPPTVFDPARSDETFFVKLPANLWAMFRAGRRMKRMRAAALRRFRDDVLSAWLDWVRAERVRDLGALDLRGLLEVFEQRRRRTLDEFGAESLLPGFFGGLAHGRLATELALVFGAERGRELTLRLITGLDDDLTLRQSVRLQDVADGRATLAEFLEEFGHRALREMELAEPRWREDPAYIEQLVAARRAGGATDPLRLHEAKAAARRETEATLPGLLAERGASFLLESLQGLVREVQSLLPWRENAKFHLMQGYELLRDVLLEIGRRHELGEDVFYLRPDELARLETDATVLRGEIARRRIRREALRRLDMPELIDTADDLDELGKTRTVTHAGELSGEPISPGSAEGVARIVLDPAAAAGLGADVILVCPSTDPAWTPLFAHARGLVMERGGALSHGAIVARDFGLPAVVCPDATRLIPDGARLRIDGNSGRIVLLEDSSS